ncbi:MAG TPA: LemA family protein [Patescibacteria group bacterium]|nr:LemA family protein [Patescibacteria group bacterium]
MTIIYIVGGLLLVLIIWVIALYNGLVSLNVRCNEAFSDIDVQTKRRYDLIPNLVESVKGYAKHEAGVFEAVTKARSQAMQAQGMAEKAEAENMLSNTLKSLFAVAENYPELKANENFLNLQTELTDTENKIEASRRFYNANVRDFNIKIHRFPETIFAGMLGFKTDKQLFEAAAVEREAVKVQF